VKRLLVLAAILAASLLAPSSDARMNSVTKNAGAFSADSPDAYFHVFSQSTDPGGVTGYATRRGSSPAVLAGTGLDDSAAVHLGGWRNQTATYVDRVLTIKAPATFPAGVTQLTLHGLRGVDPATGEQPLSAGRFQRMNDTGGGATITLAPGEQVELDLEVTMRAPDFPTTGAGLTYTPTVTIWATWTGYADDFYAYIVPVKVFNGTGPG
jgi:hypothetical protein